MESISQFVPIIGQFISAVGLPVSEIVLLVVAAWKTMTWIAPRADAFFQAHITLIRELTAAVVQIRTDVNELKVNAHCKFDPALHHGK